MRSALIATISLHAFHPADRPRLVMCPRAVRLRAASTSQRARQPPKPRARWRWMKKPSPLRTSCMNSARISIISAHALSAVDSSRLHMWPHA